MVAVEAAGSRPPIQGVLSLVTGSVLVRDNLRDIFQRDKRVTELDRTSVPEGATRHEPLLEGVQLLPRDRALSGVTFGLRQCARFSELEDHRKLSLIEPNPVCRAEVDDDPRTLVEDQAPARPST